MPSTLANKHQDFITAARAHALAIWDAVNSLKTMQVEWNALDYSNTLGNGTGVNADVTEAMVGAVVFDTCDAIETLFGQGHATNLANLL